MTPFNEIVGAELEGVSSSEATYVDAGGRRESMKVQGCALHFSLGELVIENPFKLVSKDAEPVQLKQLVGQKVVSAYSTEEELRIVFDTGAYVSVSMKESDFVGPEAASYSPKVGSIIVFN